MIITIGGHIGAGKTTLVNHLVNALGYKQFRVGQLFRELARERGQSIEDFYADLSHNEDLERSIDTRQAQYLNEHDNIVVEGRLTWHFATQSQFDSFNILLTVAPEIGAQRRSARPEYQEKTIQEVITANSFRAQQEQQHYQTLYGIENYLDPAHYNLVIDTTSLAPEEVRDQVLKAVRQIIPSS